MKMLLRASHINFIVFVFIGLARGAYLIDFQHVLRNSFSNVKREAMEGRCKPIEPFRCPGPEGKCISIQYLCDGTPDCKDGYDEDPRLCTAAKRPPVDEIKSFLKSLIDNHGPGYLEKLFGTSPKVEIKTLEGIDKVAEALSECETLDDFARELKIPEADKHRLREIFYAIERGDVRGLRARGFRESDLADLKMFVDKLVNTNFLA